MGLIIFFAGCIKEKTSDAIFKNDIVTVENYFVSNKAPYEKSNTNIEFEIHNNGDQKIPYLEVEFFDLPGFAIDESVKGLDCNEPIGERAKDAAGKLLPKCIFTDNNALEILDARSIALQLKSTEDVDSPTPHTVSFAVRYVYFGSRDVSIPVIDGQTRKQPLTKFRQSDPSVGPIVLDMDPSIEREIAVGDKTIKENWAIGGSNPLPFLAKFKFKHVGTIKEKIKDVNILATSVRLNVLGLKTEECTDFCQKDDPTCTTTIRNLKLDPIELVDYNRYYVDIGKSYFDQPFNAPTNNISTRSALVPFDTLLCTFRPTLNQPEYSATISAFFAYKYEFIKSQEFVVQPLPVGTVQPSPTPSPTLAFSSDVPTINVGQFAKLSWSATNAISCTASGGWTGSKAQGAFEYVSPSQSTTYTLTCSGDGGSISRSVTISVSSAISPGVCQTPTFPVNACSTFLNNIILSWNTITGATQYTITKCDVNGLNCDAGSITTVNSKTYTSLSSNTQYTFKVKVSSSDGTCVSPSSESVITCTTSATSAQFSMPVLVLSYFPLKDGRLDPIITGMSDGLATIRAKTKNLVSGDAQLLTEASIYHGYKDSSATPSLIFTIFEEKEFLEPLPKGKEVPWKSGLGIYRPDYYKMLSDINICDYVDNKGVKMVWVMGYSYGNIEPVESNMAMGRTSASFWNHKTYGDVSNSEESDDLPICEKTYVLTNPIYSRDKGIEGYNHHFEVLFKFIDYDLFWNKFVGPFGLQSGARHCGWAHYPPNAVTEYSWQYEGDVVSDCEDWKPDGSGEKKIVDCHTWYAPFGSECTGDTEGFAFQRWWGQNIPGKDNTLSHNGKKMRNWWEFIGDFDAALKKGKSFVVS